MESALKVLEGEKLGFFSKAYILGISTVIDDEHSIGAEIRHINEAVIDWLKKRQSKASQLCIVYTAERQRHDEIMRMTDDLVNQDFEWRKYLLGLKEIVIQIVDPDSTTQPIREFRLKPR